jgi:hypothetical protein
MDEQPRKTHGFLAVMLGCAAALAILIVLIALSNDATGAG